MSRGSIAVWSGVSVLLGVISFQNYLLFHSLVELISVIVAASIFIIALNTREYQSSKVLEFLGVSYLFIGGLDLLHTLSYKGMGVFTDYSFYANQLWVAARFWESAAICAAIILHIKKIRLPFPGVIVAFSVLFTLIVLSIFVWNIFPVCFIAGEGQTSFKIYSEYVISGVLAGALFLLYRYKAVFVPRVRKLMIWSLMCSILAELAFTFYVNNYGLSNLAGHFFKLYSFIFVYKAIIETGLQQPYDLVFRQLKEKNDELEEALHSIKTLKGLIPICSYCHKIRDDRGYWDSLAKYLHKNTDALLSHGICPDCMKRVMNDDE
ncbi:MAG: MASE3 domain-containing protein [Fibrobacterota bacterium]